MGGGRLSLAVLMCLCSGGLINRGDYFCINGYKKMNSVKSSSKHTKQQPYWFSKCSGIPSGLRGDGLWCTWFEDKWTVVTNHPQGALPGVCCGISLLFFCCSEMLPKPQERHVNIQSSKRTATRKKEVCIQVR